MYPIAAVLVAGAAIAIERFIFLSRIERENGQLWSQVGPLLAKGDLEGAARLTQDSDTAIAVILGNGLAQARVDKRRAEVENATEEALMEVLPSIEKRTHYLGMFSNVAVLFGLLGTVMGLIAAFAALGNVDAAEKADLLSAGISEAMNCTAFGLMVAIPAMLLHSFLHAKSTTLIDSLEAVSAKLVTAISGRG
ncbi:MotA/TolQ/ExbB proton channel family protein [Sinimarinibacterium sp. NLF-5-8]|uniref:MotA/TolQ/ExbB proton channel family protein n=1 Tax=Sinimarinibacterium sp. NLF-5-8 TaxID=2698684 RepID=UPI001EE42DE4|nr:MotA/TolQ/ExbB proton channel family protein [Sinimarinibacterium sp. NLF-5-8]